LSSDSQVLEKLSEKEFVFRDLAELVLPDNVLIDLSNDLAEAPQSDKFKISEAMKAFSAAAGHAFLELMRCLTMNRCRMRRMLAHTVSDWENLQFEAEDADTHVRQFTSETPLMDHVGSGDEIWSFPLSSWAYTYKLRQLEWIVQMGFELHIYQQDELTYMYWYLRYLANTRYQHLNRVSTFVQRALNHIQSPSYEQLASFTQTFEALTFAMAEANATLSFADALCRVCPSVVSH